MQVIARKSQAACHSFLTVRRVGMVAARRSTALRLLRLGLRARWRRGRYPFRRRSLRPGCLVFFGRGCGRGRRRRHGPLGARRWSCRPLRGLGLLRGSLPLRRLRVLPRLRSLLACRAGGTLDRGGRRPGRVTRWWGLARRLRLGDAWWDRPRWGETLAGGPQRGGGRAGGGGGGTLRPDRRSGGCGSHQEPLAGARRATPQRDDVRHIERTAGSGAPGLLARRERARRRRWRS